MMLLRDSKSPNTTSCCVPVMMQIEIHSETTTVSKTRIMRTVVSLGFIGTLLVELITSQHRLVHPRTGLCIYLLRRPFTGHPCFCHCVIGNFVIPKPHLAAWAFLWVLSPREPLVLALPASTFEDEYFELFDICYVHISLITTTSNGSIKTKVNFPIHPINKPLFAYFLLNAYKKCPWLAPKACQ